MKAHSYQERVQAIAEEMAHDAGYWDELSNDKIKNQWAEKFLPEARITVAKMAEIIKQYAIQCAAIPAVPGSTVMDYLKEQGLIPDDEKEVDNDL